MTNMISADCSIRVPGVYRCVGEGMGGGGVLLSCLETFIGGQWRVVKVVFCRTHDKTQSYVTDGRDIISY